MTGVMADGGGTRRGVVVPRLVAFSAAAVLAAGALAVLSGSLADPDTVVAAATGATVTAPGRPPVPAAVGQRLPDGAVVSTGRAGSARLSTRGRSVSLGPATTLTVLDSAGAVLTAGSLLLDARRGPALRVETDSGTVAPAARALLRIDRGPVLRLAAYAGRAEVRATGRAARRTVNALHQVVVPFGGLPDEVTPLALIDGDPWEAALLARVVADDTGLRALAAGLDSGSPGRAAAAAVLRRAPVVAVAGPPSETALAYALAAAGRAGGRTPQDRWPAVRADRDAGGSWGVLAALYAAPVSRVSAVLDDLLPGAGQSQQAAGGPPAGAAGGQGPTVAQGPAGDQAPATERGTSGPAPRRSGAPPSPAPASPAPSGQPPQEPVDALVDAVVSLLPSPPPLPAR
jgi:hypothetical protein